MPMLPQSDGRRGVEPLCAAYGPACAAAISASLDQGDLRAIGFHPLIRVGILPLDRVRTLADPDLLFFNVNTADDLATGGRTVAATRIISVIGRKNAGKTTLTVALASELPAEATA